MSIVSIAAIGPGRSAKANAKGSGGVRTHSQEYRVITDSPYDTSYEVEGAFAPIGTQHPSDTAAFLVDKSTRADSKGKMIWYVMLTYSTERPRAVNPAAEPIDIEWDTDTQVEPILYDANGYAILNSAGDSYGEAVKGEVAYWTVVCTSKQLFIPSWINEYKNAVNSDSCMIDGHVFDLGTCKMKKLRISRWQNQESYRYRALTITIKIMDTITINTKDGQKIVSAWDANLIDEGLFQKFSKSGNDYHVPCITSQHHPAMKAMALDGTGVQLGLDILTGVYTQPTPDQIVFNNAPKYQRKPFSFLPITN